MPAKVWEYTMIQIDAKLERRKMTEAEFNRMGLLGWELISVIKLEFTSEDGRMMNFHFEAYFKREKA